MTKDSSRKKEKEREGEAAVISCSKSKVKRKNSMAAHVVLKGPSVVKEICIGLTLGLFAGGLWKMHHWNEQRKTRAFYDMLEKGQISVVAAEE
ncbi:cytochrome c oxidase subunit 5C isoform X1 [Dioscorea cayenensis subsp. rotundata]|uniref:Cytochrome c oxidase subunit 5C isoform X1 n=2 Tax=Dioscorea cayennensis subsp. rotundata TaxID=55577 RepID=A0AB40BMB8_DIOCR|nr:cytochrome c oxidase subunit 5C isoform X1 [Dioscorea cayenensis subsp. rotundata]